MKRLAPLGLLAATPAMAEVCDKTRPLWSPADGPVTVWTEPLYMLASPLGLLAVGLALLALVTRRRWIALPAALAMTLLTATTITALVPDPTGLREFAMTEGCEGPAPLSILLCLAISLATFRAVWIGPRARE